MSLAVVVPARNEVDHLADCVEACLAQDLPGAITVTVLDDASTDGTGELLDQLAQAHDEVVALHGSAGPLPAGWLGKPWACQRAAAAAIGATLDDDGLPTTPAADSPEWLLFIDADVRLAPHAASAAVAYAIEHELAMLSGLGRLEMGSFWEKVLQPAVGGLIVAGNDLHRVNDPERRGDRPLANGQFILLSRDAWLCVGGHAAVKGDVLDDVGMASAITRAGLPYRMLYMQRLFSCRMYDSLGALWEGWTKNLFAGLGGKWSAVAAVVGFLLVEALFPYGLLVAGLMARALGGSGWLACEGLAWGAVLVALEQGLRFYLDGVFDQDRRYGLTHPLAMALLVILIVDSAIRSRRGTATWKGRRLGPV